MSKTFIFDNPKTVQFTQARQEFLRAFLPNVARQLGLANAIDVGCGVGDFALFLRDLGFDVSAVDGRQENIEEARRRIENVSFYQANVEDMSSLGLGSFDLVLCVGLLYHLENPFRAIRNLFALTGKALIVESMCVPDESTALYLLDEARLEDQGLDYVAFYPSERCLIKMLYRSGFPFVYTFRSFPDHQEFRRTVSRERSRTMLVASRVQVDDPALNLAQEPGNTHDLWLPKWPAFKQRLAHFLKRSWNGKVHAVGNGSNLSAR